MSNKIYKSIDVWKSIKANRLARFRCFQLLGEEKYFVQSCDFIHIPIDEKQVLQLEKQVIELFLELLPVERATTYSTLEEAIYMHEKEFEDFAD